MVNTITRPGCHKKKQLRHCTHILLRLTGINPVCACTVRLLTTTDDVDMLQQVEMPLPLKVRRALHYKCCWLPGHDPLWPDRRAVKNFAGTYCSIFKVKRTEDGGGRVFLKAGTHLRAVTVHSSSLPHRRNPRAHICTVLHYRHSQTCAVVNVPEDLAQVGIQYTCRHLYIYIYIYICHTRKSSWNPYSNALEPNRPLHDLPAASVIAQQYSSATFASLHFNYHNKKFAARLKILFQYIFSPF